jgi:hypothetical protein
MIIPGFISTCTGIRIAGQVLRSFLFSTDVAIIRNTNADAIIAVYPFAPQSLITQSLILASDKPVFCGVGGDTGSPERILRLSRDAEDQGALGVVLNTHAPDELIKLLKVNIRVKIILTIVGMKEDIKSKIAAGVDIFNVSGAAKTAEIVGQIRDIDPEIPVIATGGKSDETIMQVIRSGANAISFTPPSTGELFRDMMNHIRKE